MRTRPYRPSALTWPCLLVVATAFVAFMGCNATLRTLNREAKPLAYVGQVQLGEPKNEAGRVVVPLTYTGGDWQQNSAIVPIDVDATVSDSEIEITVITSLAKNDDAHGGYRLILPEDSRGEYTVYYRDPDGARHHIGEVRLEE